jgi:hypothetical protein
MEKECSVCGGERQVVGQLGKLVYFRCRHCGMGSMTRVEDMEYTEQDEEDYYEERKRENSYL